MREERGGWYLCITRLRPNGGQSEDSTSQEHIYLPRGTCDYLRAATAVDSPCVTTPESRKTIVDSLAGGHSEIDQTTRQYYSQVSHGK